MLDREKGRTGRFPAMKPSVTVDYRSESGLSHYNIKIQSDQFEINIAVPIEVVERLGLVRNARWMSGALRIGTSAGAPAWWCVGDEGGVGTMSILIGEDDETWDIAIQLPVETVDEVIREIEACSRRRGGQ